METQKNISLRVTGYDRELRQFKVEFEGQEHHVRQTGQELPDHLKCRIVRSDEEVLITPEVENHFHSGAIRRFTVKADLTDSAGVYELIDDCGFIVYLYGAETFKFFKGKQLLCRVISTEGARPHVMLYDKDYRNTGSAFSVSKDYVKGLYDFPEDTFITSYEPENWADLRVFVENSDLPTKEKIIALIDSDLEPDYKEFTIKTEYPDEYSYLLGVCYPALRKTDYLIEYSIDVYTDVEEIVRIFRTAPSKLSLNELYVASTQFEPGSEDFVKVFETAVQMYPNDPVANLNAANVAMADGNFRQADKYLDKAGDSPEATYARGIFYTATGSYNEAEAAFKAAKAAGIMEADDMLKECAELKAYYAENR